MKKSFTIFFLSVAFSVPAFAQDVSKSDYVGARLIEGQSKPSGTEVGLAIDLQDGWYTYWRMPGDNGLAPSFDWSASENIKDVQVSWPAPKRFTTFDMHSFGYDKDVMFPMLLTPVNRDAKMIVNMKVDMVVCHEICVPQTVHVTRAINREANKQDLAMLRQVGKTVPAKDSSKNLQLGAAVLGKDSVVITATAKDGFTDKAELIIETPHAALTNPPEIMIDEKDNTRAVMKVKAPEGLDLAKELFGQKTTVTVINGADAVEKEFTF